MRFALLMSVAFLVPTLFAERQEFKRYQSVIDRQMFGYAPPGFDPLKPPESGRAAAAEQRELTQEQQKIQSSVHFSMINVTPQGDTAVGFTDSSVNPPKNYYLKVGEVRDGWKVLEADPIAATMKIAKDEIEVELKIGDNSSKGAGKTGARGVLRPPPRGGVAGAPPVGTLRSRRAKRESERAERERAQTVREEAERQRMAESQAQAAEEKAQREAESEETRKQLLAMHEELRKVREQRESQDRDRGQEPDGGEAPDEGN